MPQAERFEVLVVGVGQVASYWLGTFGAVRKTDSRRGAAVDWGLLSQHRLYAHEE
jgi:hypothetical protein